MLTMMHLRAASTDSLQKFHDCELSSQFIFAYFCFQTWGLWTVQVQVVHLRCNPKGLVFIYIFMHEISILWLVNQIYPEIRKQVFSPSKFLLDVAKKNYFVIKVNEYSFLQQTWCLDCVEHMFVSESVSHKDKISSINSIYRKKAINTHGKILFWKNLFFIFNILILFIFFY